MLNIEIFTGGMAQTNGFLVEAPGGDLLIDAPEGIADWLRSRDRRVASLLLTHGHYDHVVDVAAIQRDHDCPVWSHEPVTPDLTLENLLRDMGMPVNVESFEIDRALGDTRELTCCGLDFKVLHVPGHSPDSLCYFHEGGDAEPPVLFGGDVLFQGSIGRTDFPHGDHDLLLSGIREKLYSLDDATAVLPGHGPATTIGEEKVSNPYVRAAD